MRGHCIGRPRICYRIRDFLIAASARSWEPIVWAADALLADPQVVLLAVKQHAGALGWAAESLKSNSTILAAAATAPVWDASDDDIPAPVSSELQDLEKARTLIF